jgi:hypothetical protein
MLNSFAELLDFFLGVTIRLGVVHGRLLHTHLVTLNSSLLGALSLALRTLSNSHEAGLLTGASASLVAAVTAASGLGHDHHLLHAVVFFLSSSSGGGVFDASSNLSNFSIEFALELANVSMILVDSVLQFGVTRLNFADTSTHPLDINLDMFESRVKSI